MGKDTKFSSKIKYAGIFNFKDFYQFCFKWLAGEMDLTVVEEEYEEKIKGNTKELKVKWKGMGKYAEYFHVEVPVEFEVKNMVDVEINQGGQKVKTNQGEIKVSVKGILVTDPKGQFETDAKTKFFRGIYEKFLIPSRIKEYEDKLIGGCLEFLEQAKAFLDLEGR